MYDEKGNVVKNNRVIKQSNGIKFICDNSGIPGLVYRGGTYLYRKDAWGNICTLIDAKGNVVVKYKYINTDRVLSVVPAELFTCYALNKISWLTFGENYFAELVDTQGIR